MVRWLKTDMPIKDAVPAMVGTHLLLAIAATVVLSLMGAFPQEGRSDWLEPMLKQAALGEIVFVLGTTIPLSLVGEEIIFRGLPFLIPLVIGRFVPKLKLAFFLAAAIITSVIFGYVHGGWQYIFIVGSGGLVYSLYFIKLSHERAIRGFVAMCMAHITFDYILIAIAFLGFRT